MTYENLRNVCMLSHSNAGKTSLCEAMLSKAGLIERIGRTEDGNTVSDFDPEEIKRKISINASVVPIEWQGVKINLIDAPGTADFVGEQLEAASVCESALIAVSGKSGVSAGTERAWKIAGTRAKIVFVNKLDDIKADYAKVIEQLNTVFGKCIAPFTFPVKEGDRLTGFVDVIKMRAKMFSGDNSTYEEIPDAAKEIAERSREILLEAVAEVSEELMQKYFDGEPFTEDEIKGALKIGIKDGTVVPVICGSVISKIGITHLLNTIADYMPSPAEAQPPEGINKKTGDIEVIKCDKDAPVVLRIFRTVVDSYVGKMSYFKVLSGTLRPDSVLVNPQKGKEEKVGKIYSVRGKKQTEIKEICAGDIGATAKLAYAETCDTLCAADFCVEAEPIDFPKPVLSMAIEPKTKGDDEKISQGLAKLMSEDKTFTVVRDHETHQTIISGTGEQHLTVICSKLEGKFGVGVKLTDPKVAYRESIRTKVKAEGKHKKQSGGHGQYGHVIMEFEPTDSDELVFEEKVFGGSVPKNFFPAVEKGIKDSMQHGVLAGYPVVNLKATLLDGSYHPVDSSEMAFKTAASIAFKEGLPKAKPVILEPVGTVKATVPNSCTGDVVGDLNRRRGRILGMNPKDEKNTEVEAIVPAAEMLKYATDLRALSNGRGSFEFVRTGYEETPPNISEKIIEAAKNK